MKSCKANIVKDWHSNGTEGWYVERFVTMLYNGMCKTIGREVKVAVLQMCVRRLGEVGMVCGVIGRDGSNDRAIAGIVGRLGEKGSSDLCYSCVWGDYRVTVVYRAIGREVLRERDFEETCGFDAMKSCSADLRDSEEFVLVA